MGNLTLKDLQTLLVLAIKNSQKDMERKPAEKDFYAGRADGLKVALEWANKVKG